MNLKKAVVTTGSFVAAFFVGSMLVLPVAHAAKDEKNINAGISAMLSYNLEQCVASIESNNAPITASKNVSVNEELITVNSEGNETICGYINLGICSVDGNLNVRNNPSTDATIVGKIPNKAGCEVLEITDGWVRIESGNVKGWVSKDYMLTGNDALAVVNDVAKKVVKATGDGLRVRKEASTDSEILDTVSKGEQLEVIKEGKEWIKVSLDNEEGYVSAKYVSVSYELATASTLKELNSDPSVSSTRSSLVQYALQFVGGRYVWGGTSLTNGVDCSGFTMQVYAHFGISLPHYSASQAGHGTSVSASEAKPGDLFFYGSGRSISHVAIYIGNGQIVHASSPSTGIKISNAFYRTPIKIVSLLGN